MSLRKTHALLALGIAPLIACGGGGSSDTTPPPTTAPAAAATSTGTASIAGKVSYSGEPAETSLIKMSADPRCHELHPDGLERSAFIVSEDGGVADVVVYVKGVSGSYPAPAEASLLDQDGCNYSPHSVALMTGQQFTIRNSDATLHNIHPRPKKNAEFNVGQPRQGMETTKTFTDPELLIPVGCDVHPWMRAYVSVFDHPFFAVTGADGSFEIKGLAAGEYAVEAIHPTLETVSGTITVEDGGAATLNLAYGASAETPAGEAAEEPAEEADDDAASEG